LVAVLMMPKVGRRGAGLMLAIDAHARPGELEGRDEHEKKAIRIWLCLKGHRFPSSSNRISVVMSAP